MITVGSYVKVKAQDISGPVVEDYGTKIVIEDDCSEYDYPDNRLEYRKSEVRLIKENE